MKAQGQSRGHVAGAKVYPSQAVLDIFTALARLRMELENISLAVTRLSNDEMDARAARGETMTGEPEDLFRGVVE